MWKVLFFFLISFSLSLFTLATEYTDEIVATVGNKPITQSLVVSTMKVFNVQSEDEALDFIITSFIVLDYAAKRGINISDDEIEKNVLKLSEEEDRTSLENSLLSLGMTFDEYKDFAKARYIADQIFLELGGNLLITDQELYSFYQKWEEKIKKAFERRYVLYAEIDSTQGKDKDYTTHENIQKFKALGWIRRGELLPDFDKAIFSSPSTGFYSLQKEGKTFIFFVKDINIPDFPYLKNTVEFREFYIREKYKEVFGRWVELQKQKISVKVQKKREGK